MSYLLKYPHLPGRTGQCALGNTENSLVDPR